MGASISSQCNWWKIKTGSKILYKLILSLVSLLKYGLVSEIRRFRHYPHDINTANTANFRSINVNSSKVLLLYTLMVLS